MKKIILSVFILATTFVSLNSCRKKDPSQVHTLENTVTSSEKLFSCPFSNINTTDYFTLGVMLTGSTNNGLGSSGSIDNYLNCNPVLGPHCNVVNTQSMVVYSYTTDPNDPNGWPNPLSDGIMTVAEQQTLANYIQMFCNNHKNTTYGSSYTISNYDVSFIYALCGGCPDGITIQVKYTAGKLCRN